MTLRHHQVYQLQLGQESTEQERATPNAPLLRATLARIKQEGHHWDQTGWRRIIDPAQPATPCNTSMCFAGWAVTIDGGQWLDKGGFRDLLHVQSGEEEYMPGLIHVRERAIRVLGLTQLDANNLFAPENTIEDLERIVTNLIGDAK